MEYVNLANDLPVIFFFFFFFFFYQSCYSSLKPHRASMEPSSVSYVTLRCTGPRQGLNHQTRGFRNFKSVCLASFVLIPYKSISKEKGSFVINMPHIEV